MYRFSTSIACVILLAAVSFTGQANAAADIVVASSEKSDRATVRAYEKKMEALGADIQRNSSYVRIPIDTKKDEDWMNLQLFKLFDSQISKEQFVEEGLSRFPGFKASFEYLADKVAD